MKMRFGVWAAIGVLAAGAAGAESLDSPRLGCQLRTFGQGVYKNSAEFEALLKTARELGFAGIETNWKNLEPYFDDPLAFAALLKTAGVALAGAHIGGSPWVADRETLVADLGRAAGFVKAVGGEFMVFSGQRPPGNKPFMEGVPEMARFMNELGAVCAGHGVRLLYHNHWWECEDGALLRLAEQTDPSRVGFALDTGHALRVGLDPVMAIDTLGSRLGLVHFADYSEADASVVKRPPLGTGRMDLPAVAAAIRRAGAVRWVVLEEESAAADGRALAEQGLAAMKKAFGR